MKNPYDVVLFDLGGVLIELAGVPIWQSWTGADNEAEVWERWLRSTAVRRFESGRAGADEFAREIIAEFGLAITPETFIAEFTLWPKGVYPGARALVEAARRRVRVGCLSNCNELHWPRFLREMELQGAFDDYFSSHELGALKPDREIFELVLAELDCPGERVLFLDDNQLNVDGARAAGVQARRVRGPDEARAVLTELDLLG